MLRMLNEAQRAYARAVSDVQVSHGAANARAYREAQSAIEQAHLDYRDACMRAAEQYETTKGQDPGAYDDYVAAVQRAWTNALDRVADANAAYGEEVIKAVERSASDHQDAFRAYAASVQSAIASIDTQRVMPELLVRAAHAIGVVASYAASTPRAVPNAGTSAGKTVSAKRPRTRNSKRTK